MNLETWNSRESKRSYLVPGTLYLGRQHSEICYIFLHKWCKTWGLCLELPHGAMSQWAKIEINIRVNIADTRLSLRVFVISWTVGADTWNLLVPHGIWDEITRMNETGPSRDKQLNIIAKFRWLWRIIGSYHGVLFNDRARTYYLKQWL